MNKLKNLVLVFSLVLGGWASGKDLSQLSYDDLTKCYSGEQDENLNHCDDKVPEYILRHCNKGNFDACRYIGTSLGYDFLDERLIPSAKNIFETHCDSGHMESCGYLGIMYEQAYGVKKDLNKAKQLYEKSCNGNAGNGCEALATLYENGKAGLKKNFPQALKLYEKACKLDDVLACQYLSDLYKEGKKVKKDMNKSYKYQKRVCDMGGFQDECSAEEIKFLEKY